VSETQVTILEGSTFCVCDERGDIDGSVTGLFAADTRFLSRFVLTVNGCRPLLLANGKVEYYSAAFWLRNPVVAGLEPDELSIARQRFVGDAMQEHIEVVNHASRPVAFELALELGSDFADIFAVKARDFALGDPLHAPPLPPCAPVIASAGGDGLVVGDGAAFAGRTQIVLSRPATIEGGVATFAVQLLPRERWQLRVDVLPVLDGSAIPPEEAGRHFGGEQERVRESLEAWHLRVPQLRADWDDLERCFACSVSDIASLRMNANGFGDLPAAGMPWFMAIFGRDTIVTCLQTLLFGPELAHAALRVLAALQAREDDAAIDAEPGKIVHEVRHGRGAAAWFARYYGTLDATPLYLVLLSEVWRWTDDADLVAELREPALAALSWIDRFGDRDGDGFLEYERRSPRGLANQSWKDSGISQLFADGRAAETPIAPCEVQGYAYDAKLRLAEIAREAWRDRPLAERLEREAAVLRDRFDEAFWCEERGGYFALALDRDKRRVDSLCSNAGQLLWSGIVKPERVDALVDRLMGEELWSGWGVRTMSTADAGYNPLTYHNGTVWPHDSSLIAWGLARYERWPEAYRIVRRLLDAARFFDHQLPEVFAGFARAETPFPVPYPTSSKPQAWAAGAPVLLLRLLLGLEPDRRRQALVSRAPADVPAWAGSLRLAGVRAFGRSFDVRLANGTVSIEAS
jgi:glycogen debranching enzyme